jgi:ParB-like chromosome segregation protein Spo0J
MNATNGQAVRLELSAVYVGERRRQDYGDLDALKQSMHERGLYHAIGVNQNGNLIYGARRYEAAARLGWTSIPARVFDVDAVAALTMEDEENALHKDLTWTEKLALAEAIKEAMGDRRRHNADANSPKISIQENSPESKSGEQTRDIAAKKGGLGNSTTHREVKRVVEKGVREVVEALDLNQIAPHVAAKIAALPQESQAPVLEQILRGRNADAAIAEAKPKDGGKRVRKPSAHDAPVLKDALGKTVGDLQKDAFGDPAIPKFIEQLEAWVSALVWQPVLKGLEARQYMFPALARQMATFEAGMKGAEQGLTVALAVLKNTRPYTICPRCAGVGKDEDGACTDCEGGGFLTQCRHEELWGKAEAL